MKYVKIIVTCLICAVILTACNDSDKNFDNKLFIDVQNTIEELLFESGSEPVTIIREMNVSTAVRAENEIVGKFIKSPGLVDAYNSTYVNNALLLPEEMCVIENPDFTVAKGAMKSQSVEIEFTGLEKLDRELMYVMPVELTNVTGIDVLQSKTVTFFVFRGADLINVVADIAENYFYVNWQTPNKVMSLRAVTIEALINVRDFSLMDGKKESSISTIFGIENRFLIRIGDAAFPQNQIQLVTGSTSKFPDSNTKLGLPSNEWVHIAVIWDGNTNKRIIYHNGKEMVSDNGAVGTVNLTDGDCYIGKSYDDKRWLEGCISEMRVWSVHRTQEEITDNIYDVDPNSEGLEAYWKFNEGEGNIVKDHTANGNHLTAARKLQWNKVSLPAKKQ